MGDRNLSIIIAVDYFAMIDIFNHSLWRGEEYT